MQRHALESELVHEKERGRHAHEACRGDEQLERHHGLRGATNAARGVCCAQILVNLALLLGTRLPLTAVRERLQQRAQKRKEARHARGLLRKPAGQGARYGLLRPGHREEEEEEDERRRRGRFHVYHAT